jgi:hypothetical protein
LGQGQPVRADLQLDSREGALPDLDPGEFRDLGDALRQFLFLRLFGVASLGVLFEPDSGPSGFAQSRPIRSSLSLGQ